MSIAKVNELERRGDIAGALELNSELIRASTGAASALAEVYRRNEQRLLAKVEGPDRWSLLGRALVGHGGPARD
jgi:hypothetical protein